MYKVIHAKLEALEKVGSFFICFLNHRGCLLCSLPYGIRMKINNWKLYYHPILPIRNDEQLQKQTCTCRFSTSVS